MPWLHQQRPRPHKKDDPAFGETTRKDFKYTIRIPREWGSGKRNIQEPGSKAIHLHLPLALKPQPKRAHQGAAAQSTFRVARKLMLTLSLTIIISIPQTFSRQSGKAVAQGLDGGADEGVHFG